MDIQNSGHPVRRAVKSEIVRELAQLLLWINERLMTLRLRLNNNRLPTVISAYAPTLDAEKDIKDLFYSQLDQVLTVLPSEDKLILLGTFMQE